MTFENCSVNQLLPVELLQNILQHVTNIRDIKSYRLSCRLWHRISSKVAKAEMHVRLNSRVRAVAFVNDLVQHSFIGPQVDKITITTEQCDMLDLQNISGFCTNLKNNQIKFPHLQDIQIPEPTRLHNGIFALGIYFRFHRTLTNLELSIDPTLNQLLKRNYGGLALFVSNFKQLKTLQLNCNCQEGMNFVDLQPLCSKYNASLRKIKIEGVGELLIKNSTTSDKDGLAEITVKSDILDVQSLISAINALKKSSNTQVIEKLVIYSSFSEKFANAFVETILDELSDYYRDHRHLFDTDTVEPNPVLIIGFEGANAWKWSMTSTGNFPLLPAHLAGGRLGLD
ncbi:unnamed protein product [Mucor circinelloides]